MKTPQRGWISIFAASGFALLTVSGCSDIEPQETERADIAPIVADALCGAPDDKTLALARLTELPEGDFDTVSELADEQLAKGCAA